jgi:hypothetical protein
VKRYDSKHDAKTLPDSRATDQNILYQQTLTGRRIALVVLSTNFWWTIRGSLDAMREAVNAAHAGSYTTVTLERPPLRRRPYPPPIES